MGGREQGTQGSRLTLLVWVWLSEEKKEVYPFALFPKKKKKKKAEEESKSVHRVKGHSTPPSDVLSHMHTLTYSAKICMEGWCRSFQSW